MKQPICFCALLPKGARNFFPKVGSGLGSLVRLAQAPWPPRSFGPLVAGLLVPSSSGL